MLKPKEYIDAGLRIAPIKKGEAHPPFNDWQKRIFKASDFKQHHGIAIVLGQPESNPIIDVDLDMPESVQLASTILPDTGCIFGRFSNPQSHYLYRVKGTSRKWKQNKIGSIAELLSSGHVAVAPPSVHSSGEHKEWHKCEPKQIQTIGYDELIDRINTLASCALLARLWPTQGMRHEYALGVGGWMAKELDLTTDAVERIIKRMMQFVQDEEHDDRVRAATESARSHHQGKTVSAFNTLEPIIGKTYAIALRKWSKRPTLTGRSNASPSVPNDTSGEGADGDPIRGTSEGVVDALDRLEVEVRCNVRTMNSEFRIRTKELQKRLGNPPSSEWIEDGDDVQAVLRVSTETKCTFVGGKKPIHAHFPRQKWEDGMMFARSLNMVDPFKEYLESLPKWNGKSYLWEVPTTIWNLRYPEEAEYSAWSFASRLIAAVDRTYNPGAIADEMVIFQSDEEGVLKSTSIGLLFPPDLKVQRRRSAWLHEGLKLDTFDPRQPLESIGQAVFVEAGEMAGRRKVDVDKLKQWLSQRHDQHRFAYGRVAKWLPRRFIVFGTSNEVDCLPSDMNAARRYLPMALKRGMNGYEAREWFNAHREQIWAEALHHYRDGTPHFLPDSGDIRDQHRVAVARHRGGAEMAEVNAGKVLDKIEDPLGNWLFEHDGKRCISPANLIAVAQDQCNISSKDMHHVYKGLKLAKWFARSIRRNGRVQRVWVEES